MQDKIFAQRERELDCFQWFLTGFALAVGLLW